MKLKNLSPTLFARALALLAALTFSAASQAVPITFSFAQDYDENLTSVLLESDGISLTAGGFSPDGLNLADSDGLCFAGWGDAFAYCKHSVDFLSLTFSESVRLLSYTIGYFTDGSNNASTVNLEFKQGTTVSNETGFVAGVDTNFMNTDFVVEGGQALNVNASNFLDSYGSVQVLSITVERVATDVPAPAPLVLIGLGLAGLGYSRKRKAKR